MNPQPETLARRLGTTPHVSALLRKAFRLGLKTPHELHVLAVQRGCRHYAQGDEPSGELASTAEFTNEELALALLNVALPYDPESIRRGAALLGAAGNRIERLAELTRNERSEIPVCYVARAGRRYEPGNPFWPRLQEALPDAPEPKPGVMPHPTRFVAMTGFTPRGRELVTVWLRPEIRQSKAA
jgi:hypothetical protein